MPLCHSRRQDGGFLVDLTADAGLRRVGLPGVDLFDTPASIHGFAGEFSAEHPGGADHYATAEVIDFVAQLTVLFFPGGGECPLAFSNPFLAPLVAVRLGPFSGALCYGAIFVIVNRPAAPILCPLFALDPFPRLDRAVAELGEKGVPCTYDGDGGRAYIETAGGDGDVVLRFLVRHTCKDQRYRATCFIVDGPFYELHPAGQGILRVCP